MFTSHNFNNKANKHSFIINDVDLAIVNSIRRIILSDIPTIGLYGEDKEEEPTVEIIINNSPLHNEFMIHRIGLIPLNISEEITEEYEDNDYTFELNIENKSSDMINITTDNFIGEYKNKKLTKAELDIIFPLNKVSKSKILITRLKEKEHIHIKAKAIKRTGQLNASFSPVSLSNFSFVINKDEADKYDNVLDKERSYYKNKYGEPSKINFEIESINALSYKYLFKKALEIINEKLENLIVKLLAKEVEISKVGNCDNSYEFKIINEDDTLGNLIQSILHNKYIRSNDKTCSYVGYICAHPLISELTVRFTLNSEDTAIFYDFFVENCRDIIKIIDNIKSEWIKFTS
jgi:DNA-directed RNA polymerase subunit L